MLQCILQVEPLLHDHHLLFLAQMENVKDLEKAGLSPQTLGVTEKLENLQRLGQSFASVLAGKVLQLQSVDVDGGGGGGGAS